MTWPPPSPIVTAALIAAAVSLLVWLLNHRAKNRQNRRPEILALRQDWIEARASVVATGGDLQRSDDFHLTALLERSRYVDRTLARRLRRVFISVGHIHALAEVFRQTKDPELVRKQSVTFKRCMKEIEAVDARFGRLLR